MNKDWYLILLCVGGIFLLNYVLPSDLNNWSATLNFSLDPLLHDDVMQAETEWKYNNSEFGRRPFMVNVMRYGTRWTGLPSPLFFALVQFTGFLACLLVLHRLTKCVWSGKRCSPLGLLPFVLLFPNVFLFTAHAHTYDDLYQYLLLLTALYGAVDQRPLLALTCAAAACVVRETSVLFLPILGYLLWQHAGWSLLRATLAACFAGAAAALLLWWYIPASLANKTVAFSKTHRLFAWRVNFQDYAHTSETLVLSLIILIPFVTVAYRYRKEILQQPLKRDLVYSALFLCLVNTAVVYLAALAREARLLVLPLLPLLPVVGPILLRECRHGALQWREYSGVAWTTALMLALCTTVAYRPSVGGTGYFYQLYVFCWVGAWSLFLYRSFTQMDGRQREKDSSPIRDAAELH